MKVKEKFQDNHDGTFTVGRHTQTTRTLKGRRHCDLWALANTRTHGVGSIPMHLLEQWMKEEGVAWEDSEGASA